MSWLNWLHFPIHEGGLIVVLIDCLVFMSKFLDVARISMSAVCFLVQLDSAYRNFPLTYELNAFRSRINKHLLVVGFF